MPPLHVEIRIESPAEFYKTVSQRMLSPSAFIMYTHIFPSTIVIQSYTLNSSGLEWMVLGVHDLETRPDRRYIIRLGLDIDDVTESPLGVDLPVSVVEDPQAFESEVINRIRRYVGSPLDN